MAVYLFGAFVAAFLNLNLAIDGFIDKSSHDGWHFSSRIRQLENRKCSKVQNPPSAPIGRGLACFWTRRFAMPLAGHVGSRLFFPVASKNQPKVTCEKAHWNVGFVDNGGVAVSRLCACFNRGSRSQSWTNKIQLRGLCKKYPKGQH